ncbi:CHAT domain protein [compost metagenome]
MAFTYAGVPSLVMGLWSLPDASTSEIMIEYYRQLLGSKYKNAALATAKTSYLQGFEDASELQHPFYWAGLVVSGDVKPIYPAAVRWYWAVAVAAVLAMLAFVVVQRSVHRKPPLVS